MIKEEPLKILFDNDTTCTLNCGSKWHNRGSEKNGKFTDQKLINMVDETAETGIDIHKLSPGHGLVPWWKSQYYPAEEHYKWFEKTFKQKPDAYGNYMLSGGDMVATFIKRCRKQKISPFISLRLNHVKYRGDNTRQMDFSKFLYDNPKYRLITTEQETMKQLQFRQNWFFPEVRAHFLKFIEELCEYDIDGLELDFMRFPYFFRIDQTNAEQRQAIMTDFIRKTRERLDKKSKNNQKRWLCLRVPCYLAEYSFLGLNPANLGQIGVDILNVSSSYYTQQQTDFEAIRSLATDCFVYLEMADCIDYLYREGKRLKRSTTDKQFYTTAHLAYSRGADGVSMFNFHYFRRKGVDIEPPFHIFKHLDDSDWLARQPQHYFVSKGYGGYEPTFAGSSLMTRTASYEPESPFPCEIKNGENIIINMDMAPPKDGWNNQGKLRLQGVNSLKDCKFSVVFNDCSLQKTNDVSEPYSNSYINHGQNKILNGKKEDWQSWILPVKLAVNGNNKIEIKLEKGTNVSLIFLDVAIS